MMKHYRITAVLTLMAMFCVVTAFASGTGSEKEAIALADDAMKKIVADDIDGAIDLLRPHTSLDWGEYNALSKRTAEMYRTRPAGFGDPLGYVYIKHESMSDTLLRVTFIEKCKRKPLQWDFFFYKPGQDWLLSGLTFNAAEVTMFSITLPPPPHSTPGPSQP